MGNRTVPQVGEPFCYSCHMGNVSPCDREHRKWIEEQMPKGVRVIPEDRKAEILIGGQWSEVAFKDLKAGDLVRMFEPNGLQVDGGEISLVLTDTELVKALDGESMIRAFNCLPAGRKLEEEADAG